MDYLILELVVAVAVAELLLLFLVWDVVPLGYVV
jgi:hypothetical protein